MDSSRKHIRIKYCAAFAVGMLSGLYLLGLQAYDAASGVWYLPHWDPQYVSTISPEILAQLHQAIILRFCAYFLESGAQCVFLPAVAACCIVKISFMFEKHPFLECFANAFWVFIKLFAVVVLFELSAGLCWMEPHFSILEFLFYHHNWFGAMLFGVLMALVSVVYLFIRLGDLHQENCLKRIEQNS